MIKIGTWNKQFDIVTLILQTCILIAFLVATLYNFNFLGFLLIYLIIAVGHTIRIARRNYVHYYRGTFIIDNLFRKKKIIKAVYFLGLSRSPLAMPFSDVIVLCFTTGEEIAVNGGGDKIKDVEGYINRLIEVDKSNS